MLRETALSGLLAGLIAALVLTLVQSLWVTPLILQAEVYEDQAEVGAAHHEEGASPATSEHHHDAQEWKPQDGWERTVFTFAANLLMGVGYALVLVAVYLLWREPKSIGWGSVYGLGGFVVFFLAPGMGLPPELPGTAAAALTIRQQWWVMTAGATGIGLLLLFSPSRSRGGWLRILLGLAVIAAPHWIPAPRPAVEGSLAPAELTSEFRLATTVSNALFWLSLGLASSAAFRKLALARERGGT